MNRLCEIGSPVLAAEILSRLDQESIPAEVTHNIGSAIFHPANRDRSQSTSVIWILDAEDLPRARELAEEPPGEEGRARVTSSGRLSDVCPTRPPSVGPTRAVVINCMVARQARMICPKSSQH